MGDKTKTWLVSELFFFFWLLSEKTQNSKKTLGFRSEGLACDIASWLPRLWDRNTYRT
jgi:hypothetical protein